MSADGSGSGGLELQLTLLHAALSGGRCATLTEPFPPAFEPGGAGAAGADEGRDYDALRSTVASLPPLAALVGAAGAQTRGLGGQQGQLLQWLQVTLAEIRPVALERVYLTDSTTGAAAAAAMAVPSHQFSVRATVDALRQQRWDTLASEVRFENTCHFGTAFPMKAHADTNAQSTRANLPSKTKRLLAHKNNAKHVISTAQQSSTTVRPLKTSIRFSTTASRTTLVVQTWLS